MAVTIEDIKKLKELTGIGLTDAKKALVEAEGDFDKALEALRKKGLTKAEKKGDRETREGLIESYVHSGRIGVIVEVNCETDFVARLPEFKEFAHQIAMQIAAMAPKYATMDDIPSDVYEASQKLCASRSSTDSLRSTSLSKYWLSRRLCLMIAKRSASSLKSRLYCAARMCASANLSGLSLA